MIERGARLTGSGASFAVWAPEATGLTLCLFAGDDERQVTMARDGAIWRVDVPGITAGQRYGFRADGEWAPGQGLHFDPSKLLTDPYATAIDRPFVYDARLGTHLEDTADLVPKSVLEAPLPDVVRALPRFAPGGLIYELNVRAFTMLHPDVPEAQRGTVAALAHPAIIAHFRKLHVSAIELMPIVAWIDERHLPPLGLTNAWGYNPVVPMALEPRLVPGGMTELRETVARLHEAGIGVLLDLVFNHSGESDRLGPTLSMRGLGERSYYAMAPAGRLINDTGTGNTLRCDEPEIRALIIASLRHFVRQAGVDGFRFDLAPVMARGPTFDERAPIFAEIDADPWLADRLLIAEPWDIGPGGYQLGRFPDNWLEWNDRYRDDVRRFWRGDAGIDALVTRIAGSSDIFGKPSRTVNFIAAHDGFTLADTVAYVDRHNEANGEQNRDGHGENYSTNHGVEGPTQDETINADRQADLRAQIATLFASTGAIMLTAGDEFGRTQRGNNNAYAQDNDLSWVDWIGRDQALEDFTASVAQVRAATPDAFAVFPEPGIWRRADGAEMTAGDWEYPHTQAVRYDSPLADGRRFQLSIDRAERRVLVDIVKN